MEKIFDGLVDDLSELFKTWEDEPARLFARTKIIDICRHVFEKGALYGYYNGLNKNSINIYSEMSNLGILNNNKIHGTDTAT